MNTARVFGNTIRYLAHNSGWGSAFDEATHFCEDYGFMGGAVVTWPVGDVDYVYSYLATPPTIYSGHLSPNVQVQREIACMEYVFRFFKVVSSSNT